MSRTVTVEVVFDARDAEAIEQMKSDPETFFNVKSGETPEDSNGTTEGPPAGD